MFLYFIDDATGKIALTPEGVKYYQQLTIADIEALNILFSEFASFGIYMHYFLQKLRNILNGWVFLVLFLEIYLN